MPLPVREVGVLRSKAARHLVSAADLALAGTAALAGASLLLARQPRRQRSVPPEYRRLLAIDSMYSLRVLRARQAEHMFTHRDLDGYFDHVWSVNPLVGADPRTPSAEAVGPLTITPLTSRHTVVEGRTQRYRALERLPYLNFALAQVQLVLQLDRIVDRERVCMIRAHPYYHGLLALLLGRLNGCPVEVRIVADHDAIYEKVGAMAYPRLFPWRTLEQWVARFTLCHADSVVVYSTDNSSFALRNGVPAERLVSTRNWSMVHPVHSGEPRVRTPLEDEFGLGDRPVVACVSRLEAMKHPEDVVVSVAKARRRDPRIAAVIVGDGTMRDELESLCVEFGAEDHIVFAGVRDQRWISRMLAQATVIAAPLAGIALVEAALSRTPIVAYDYEWHSELIRSGQEGLLVAYRDTDAMAAAICELVANPDMCARLAAAARARSLELMQPEKLIAHERALADQLLAAFGAKRAVT